MIAALYVEPGGVYCGVDGIETWGLPDRDARDYGGPWPVIAHPPCSTWCRLAPVNQARYGIPIGYDGGCFWAALAAVNRWGGVLEHPALSIAWPTFGLEKPVRGSWQSGGRGWVTEVSQSAYGHRARKRTWLYYVGDNPIAMRWNEPSATAWIGNDGSKRAKYHLSKREAKRTPIAFRDELIRLVMR